MNLNKQTKSSYLNELKLLKKKFVEEYSKIELNSNMTSQQKIDEANKYNRLSNICNLVTENLLQANRNAVKNINKELVNVYQYNYNSIAEELKKDDINIKPIDKTESKDDINENENPYNVIAINNATDKSSISRNIMNTLFTSILGLASAGSAFVGLKQLYEKNLNSSIRIATTQITRIENLARQVAYGLAEKQAEESGRVMVKVWYSQRDDRVRDSHARADGQEAQMDRPFYVGGEELMFPCDIGGSPENIINCRCYIKCKFIKK